MKKMRFRQLVVLSVFAMFAILASVGNGTPASVSADLSSTNARIYLYDPTTSQFIFTYDVSSAFSDAKDIAINRNGSVYEVWFTLRDGDQIARLDYADPTTHSIVYYDVPEGSGPANLLYSDGSVWFTAPGGNYVGHLDPSTGTVTQVNLPTANSFPADLDVASDGSIWFTEFNTGQLGHITGSGPYALTETSETAWEGSKPYGIAVDNTDAIYVASSAADHVLHYRPSTGERIFIVDFFGYPHQPYRLTMDHRNKAWGTVLTDNAIEMFDAETLAIVNTYPLDEDNSLPVAIDVDSTNTLWFAQQNSGQIGHLDGTDVWDTTESIDLPEQDDAPVGIVTDDLDRVWVLVKANIPNGVYLPMLLFNN